MRNRPTWGFTLLEVMIALAIIAIGLSALLKGVASYGLNANYLRDKTFAHWVAMNQLTEWQVQGIWPKPGPYKKGNETMASQVWYWQANVKETLNIRVRQISIVVKKEGEQLVALDGFIAKPIDQ